MTVADDQHVEAGIVGRGCDSEQIGGLFAGGHCPHGSFDEAAGWQCCECNPKMLERLWRRGKDEPERCSELHRSPPGGRSVSVWIMDSIYMFLVLQGDRYHDEVPCSA